MKHALFYLIPGILVSMTPALAGPPDRVLWYASPAADWETEALPIGNGRLGGMVFGGISTERIQFNEDTLWIGDERDTGAYQAFGDLFIEFGHAGAKGYRRELDLDRAVHTITYESEGIHYVREYFSSHPAGVMVFRFSADRNGAHSGVVSLTDMHRGRVTVESNRITSRGSLEGFVHGEAGRDTYDVALRYEAQVLVMNEGGSIRAADGRIVFQDVDRLMILLAAGTDYLNQRERGWKGDDPHRRVADQLMAASTRGVDELLDEHMADYRGIYDRLDLDIGTTSEGTLALPANVRLLACRQGAPDPDLEELMFQYARYLMISCSRPGAMPANLQGLWNQSNNPPWRSDYHSDVNIQMNYWFVDPANLSECFGPLAEWVHSIRDVRREETKKTFNTRGWLSHAENGIFGGSTWKWSKGDAAWIAQNLWDHYAFTLDTDYLRERAYPVMKELCEFWEDHLKALPDGRLVSPDGFSPEHGPTEDGVSFDQRLVWDLFTNFIEASEILGEDGPFRERVASMKARLLCPRIGSWGQLQEWMVDRDDPADQHRHISHLVALHPGRQIAPRETPDLAGAARVSLNARGDGATGWSKAWKINMWARLHDGDRAYKLLSEMMRGTIYDNLFDFHPPFQIDGNFGYAAGVCEMLVQSHMGYIHLLPALPTAWPAGHVNGIRARGGFGLDIAWTGGRLVKATVRSEGGRPCRMVVAGPVMVMHGREAVGVRELEAGIIEFMTEKGQAYDVIVL